MEGVGTALNEVTLALTPGCLGAKPCSGIASFALGKPVCGLSGAQSPTRGHLVSSDQAGVEPLSV